MRFMYPGAHVPPRTRGKRPIRSPTRVARCLWKPPAADGCFYHYHSRKCTRKFYEITFWLISLNEFICSKYEVRLLSFYAIAETASKINFIQADNILRKLVQLKT